MPESTRFRLLTWNVRDLKADAVAVTRVLAGVAADVVCLQQVPRHPFSGHRVGGLGQASGLWVAAAGRGSGGTAIFTRLAVDVRASALHRLSAPRLRLGPPLRSRGAASATVRKPGGPALAVASVHLAPDGAERAKDIRRIRALLPAHLPWVLAADVQESPGDAGGRASESLGVIEVDPAITVVCARAPDEQDGVDPADLRVGSDRPALLVELQLPG